MAGQATDDPVLGTLPDLQAGDDKPTHLRIEAWLERLINSGELQPEQRLPSEVDLSGALGVSRMTLRQALGSLESKGLLVRKRGRWGGSFVARPRFEYDLPGLPGFTEQMSRSHALAGAAVVRATTTTPSAEVQHALGLHRGDRVHRVIRVRSANRMPVALEDSSYPAGLFPDFLTQPLTGSLYAVLRRYGHPPYSATEVLEPASASPEQADMLRMDEGSPLMLVRRTVCDAEGLPVEHSLDYFRPDRVRITLRTQLDQAPRAEVETTARASRPRA
ncbi:MAG: GntR family transcriptional regulator [Streptosporangiaceae bacterium]